MALLNDDLSVWEIGFRWAGCDPEQLRFRLPLAVRDNFRVLMDAILCDHLPCMTLNSEKYQGTDAEEAQLYIRYWLEEVYDCINGHAYSKRLLKWARVERIDFQRWCERRTIPLPEFWFPSGWALEYQWNEEALVDSSSVSESNSPAVFAPTAGSVGDQGEQVSGQATQDTAEPASHEYPSPEAESPEKKREYQRRAIASQVVAANLWKLHPEMTIADMVKHETIQKLCDGQHQVDEVVRRWIKVVAPEHVRKRRGRPRKEKGTDNT